VDVVVQAVSDGIPDGSHQIEVTAEAPGYVILGDVLWIEDSQAQRLALDVSIDSIGEEVGGLATTATVRRSGDTSGDLEVLLTSTDPTQIWLPDAVTIPADADAAEFEIHVINDPDVDGDQTVEVIGYVEDHTIVQARHLLKVMDDDTSDVQTIGGRLQTSLPDGAYQVLTNLEVLGGTTWRLEPGCRLEFQPDTGVLVAGTLFAEGDPDRPIVLSSAAATPAPGDWSGIKFTARGGDRNMLDHVVVEYASTGVWLHGINDPRLTLSHADVRYASGHGVAIDAGPSDSIGTSDVIIARSRVHHNGGDGIFMKSFATSCSGSSGAHPAIDGNEIYHNGGDGIQMVASYVAQPGCPIRNAFTNPLVTRNVIHDNTGNGIAGAASGDGVFGDGNIGATIQNNLVFGNLHGMWFTESGGSDLYPVITHNTVDSNREAGIFHENFLRANFVGNNVTNNRIGVEAWYSWTPTAGTIAHNNVWGNTDGNWSRYPTAFGDPTTTNGNGTPADAEMNISEDPQYQGIERSVPWDFFLWSTSPSVDAGPASGSPGTDFAGEMRGTVSDIGFDEALVRGEHIFYNRSAFDGNNPAAGAEDDGAIATDKRGLPPGHRASFVNYSSRELGLNGLMVDLDHLPDPDAIGGAQFEFLAGSTDNPADWAAAPTPSISVRPGAGVGGSDRVTMIWEDGAILKQWLRVRVKADDVTGLTVPHEFFVGNAPGESGNAATNAFVDGTDFAAARDHQRDLVDPAPVDFPWDYNRDSLVDDADTAIVRDHTTNFLTALPLISVDPTYRLTPPRSRDAPAPATPEYGSATAPVVARQIPGGGCHWLCQCARSLPMPALAKPVAPMRTGQFQLDAVQANVGLWEVAQSSAHADRLAVGATGELADEPAGQESEVRIPKVVLMDVLRSLPSLGRLHDIPHDSILCGEGLPRQSTRVDPLPAIDPCAVGAIFQQVDREVQEVTSLEEDLAELLSGGERKEGLSQSCSAKTPLGCTTRAQP
jgi:hypothetical protein